MDEWEYLTLNIDLKPVPGQRGYVNWLSQVLDDAGERDWKLVSVVPGRSDFDFAGHPVAIEAETTRLIAFFKRRKE